MNTSEQYSAITQEISTYISGCRTESGITPERMGWILQEILDFSNEHRGDTGPRGTQGPQGPQGEQGTKGEQGEQGTQGTQGANGKSIDSITSDRTPEDDGVFVTIHYADDDSYTFRLYDGPQGEKGPQGSPGPRGQVGEMGTPGTIGDKGTQGDKGPQGPQGPQGEQGTRGVEGTQGEEGTRGEKGPDGEQGAEGTQGPQGHEGTQGPQGHEGTPGPSGEIGFVFNDSYAYDGYLIYSDEVYTHSDFTIEGLNVDVGICTYDTVSASTGEKNIVHMTMYSNKENYVPLITTATTDLRTVSTRGDAEVDLYSYNEDEGEDNVYFDHLFADVNSIDNKILKVDLYGILTSGDTPSNFTKNNYKQFLNDFNRYGITVRTQTYPQTNS